jgi:hypothetical protein
MKQGFILNGAASSEPPVAWQRNTADAVFPTFGES